MEKFIYRLDTGEISFRHAQGIIDKPEKGFLGIHEIYFLWEGQVEFISEFGRRQLQPHTAVIIPKDNFHQFQFTGDDTRREYIRCNLKFGDIPEWKELINEKLQGVFILQEERITEIFRCIRELKDLNRSDMEKKILLKAYLAQILVQLPQESHGNLRNLSSLSPVTRDVISYVRRNIAGDLSLGTVAAALNLSPSHLSHVFKQDMDTSLHKYILSKRLIQANILIRQGRRPIRAAEECGFWDYSNFYNQYKKRFGHPPSKENITHTHPEDMDSR